MMPGDGMPQRYRRGTWPRPPSLGTYVMRGREDAPGGSTLAQHLPLLSVHLPVGYLEGTAMTRPPVAPRRVLLA